MISAHVRRTVRSLYAGSCGYCGVSEELSGAELTIDHFHPVSHGGSDGIDNLVYCCPACNTFKGDYWPDDPTLRLLHPLVDDVGAHLRQDIDGRLIALSDSGACQIQRLHLNRPPLVRHRLLLQERRLEQHTRTELQRVLVRIEQRLQRLEDRFS